MADFFDEGATERLASLIETRIAPALERIAAALERLPAGISSGSPADSRSSAVAEIRESINGLDFPRAGILLESFRDANPDSRDSNALEEELAEARRAEITNRQARLESARAVNDPVAVLEHRDALAALKDFGETATLDRDLARWLMMLLMKRMRSGTVREDIANLAARASESFAHLPEGASLKAALPTLRRSAGLCARCASPYVGEEDACEKCTALTPKIADLPPSFAPST